MKITVTRERNTPTTVSGYGITVKATYTSFDPDEIDELERKLPSGILLMEIDKPEHKSLCESDNGCFLCDRLLCKGKMEEQSK